MRGNRWHIFRICLFPSSTEFTIQDKDKWEEGKNRITERLIPGKQKGEVYSVVDKVLLKYLNAHPLPGIHDISQQNYCIIYWRGKGEAPTYGPESLCCMILALYFPLWKDKSQCVILWWYRQFIIVRSSWNEVQVVPVKQLLNKYSWCLILGRIL